MPRNEARRVGRQKKRRGGDLPGARVVDEHIETAKMGERVADQPFEFQLDLSRTAPAAASARGESFA